MAERLGEPEQPRVNPVPIREGPLHDASVPRLICDGVATCVDIKRQYDPSTRADIEVRRFQSDGSPLVPRRGMG